MISENNRPNDAQESILASVGFHLSAITEASAGVLGEELKPLETFQDFAIKGTAVKGGTAGERIWTDKSYVPITLKNQCIDCLHCVVQCPHHAIGYEVEQKEAPWVIQSAKQILNMLPGFHFEESTNHEVIHKSDTNYHYCKGCFVCASACPVDAIHFVPKEFVNYEKFKGAPVEVETVKEIFLAPKKESTQLVESLINYGKEKSNQKVEAWHGAEQSLYNGSVVLGKFVFQANFDMATMFPITPNTGLLKYLEDRVKNPLPEDTHPFSIRTCLSEESGYAWLTGGAVRGKRCLMAQGSQSMAQLFEHMNINPGLHLPVFMFEMTRAIAPGTSIKPDHTTTLRTADTGEIIIFGRSIYDNYQKALLLLKLMESESVWVPGRLVVKGFVETHALTTQRQSGMKYLSEEDAAAFLGNPKNPFIFDETEVRSVGILDFDARYGEQRQAIDQVLKNAGDLFDHAAKELASYTKEKPLKKVDRYPENEIIDLCLISLNDPDLHTAELVADELREQGVNAGVVSVNLYRPFPGEEIRSAVKGAKAIAILEYSNRSGRNRGAQFADEVRSALYGLKEIPKIISIQVGLGGRAVTIPYLLLAYRLLDDLQQESETKGKVWLENNAKDFVLSFGNRGNLFPETSAQFDIPINQKDVKQMVLVGKGGQGVLLLNGLLTGVAALNNECALSMVGYGALQRGGGITLSFKYSKDKIRDYSDIILTDTLIGFEDDIHLDAMLPQLKRDGTLILDAEMDRLETLRKKLPSETKIILIPARNIAIQLYNNASRNNLILFGAILAHKGVESEEELFKVISGLSSLEETKKEAAILQKPVSLTALLAGFYAYRIANQQLKLDQLTESTTIEVENLDSFSRRIIPDDLLQKMDQPLALAKAKKGYALRKKIYGLMFQLHPMVSQIQSTYLKLKGQTPISGGDMACGGCGQINIFRNVFNYLYALQDQKGKIYVSEQDGCGTVFSGMNRTSIWNMPYVRIAFETAHGVASGLTENISPEDVVVSISGDGGMMQGIRSVEDALHHQDPILHLVVVNQTLGNTGGQSTATTLIGTKTRDGHIAQKNSIDFLKLAEKHNVQGAFASTVHLADLFKKLKWAHEVIKKERKPFLLIMNFSCLEQGINLAQSLSLQKTALDAHYYNLYSLKYKEVKSSNGDTLYYQRRVTIDYFPWVFGKRKWMAKLKEYASSQAIMQDIANDPKKLEAAYGQLKGQWIALKESMGATAYYYSMLKNAFSLSRITMMRIIRKTIPKEAEK